MKVTPIKKNFGKYAPGDEFELPDKTAKILIRIKRLAAVDATYTAQKPTYQTRAMTAEELDANGVAWDASLHTSTKLKNADGTWRKKPGRAAT